MNDIVRAQRPVRLPVVLSCGEVSSLLSQLSGPVWLMASLMYGAGLRPLAGIICTNRLCSGL